MAPSNHSGFSSILKLSLIHCVAAVSRGHTILVFLSKMYLSEITVFGFLSAKLPSASSH